MDSLREKLHANNCEFREKTASLEVRAFDKYFPFYLIYLLTGIGLGVILNCDEF